MLETLVSSRIRRVLFEHILSNPDERFYLRGLAKELGLSVSPLRRELKRLERSGVLRAEQEGNILFYTIDSSNPLFLQLKQAGGQGQAEAPSELRLGVRGSGLGAVAQSPEPRAQSVVMASSQKAIPIGIVSRHSLTNPLPTPILVGAAVVGLALMLVTVGLLYLNMTNQRLVSQTSRALATHKATVTVVVPPSSASGVMQGSRWRIAPGAFGGFSSGSSSESY